MTVILFLIPLGIFFSLYFDLWAMVSVLLLAAFFVFGKKKIHHFALWFFLLYVFVFFLGFFVPAQFENYIFAIQIAIWAIFFTAGYNLKNASPISRVVFNIVVLCFFIVLPFLKTSLNPNVVSAFLALFVIFVWVGDLKKFLKILFTLLALFCIVFNGSWIAIFALLVGFATWRNKKLYWLLVAVVSVVILFVAQDSVVERVVWWSRAFDILKRHPFGIGFFSAKYFLPGSGVQNTIFFHSFLIQFVVEGGIISAFLLLAFLIFLLKNTKKENYFVFAVGFVFAAFDYSLYYTGCGMILSFLAGYSMKDPMKKTLRSSKLAGAAFYLMWASAVFLSLEMFSGSRNFAEGNFVLLRNPSKALYFYGEVPSFPRMPALYAARAVALSAVGEKNRDRDEIEESFVLAKKAIIFKDVRNPSYRDFLIARRFENLEKLRDACSRILFLNGVDLEKG